MENTPVVEKKYLLIDLDGTLTNTADIALKPMKDGQVQTEVSQIQVFRGATEFLAEAKTLGFECVIVSDSHPKYVNPIVREYFSEYCTAALSLADKPNTLKTLKFLQEQKIDISSSTCYVIGDSWLDIELGRGLQVPTVLTAFYEARNLEIRDGIGDYVKNIKSGSTYFAQNYSNILDILKNPLQNLLCLEAKLMGTVSRIARKPRPDEDSQERLTAHRVLARQSQGECDKYHATAKYFEFGQVARTQELLFSIRDAVMTYLELVLETQSYLWDIFTYVPDKQTTQPANKMGELFDLIVNQIRQSTSELSGIRLFEWKKEVNSSTRKQSTAEDRRRFINNNINLLDGLDIEGKSIIILDDQYTTGATADTLLEKLRANGAKNILFIALFQLINSVDSNRDCPKCLANGLNKPLQLKINRETGVKFYSCVPPKAQGDGCGYSDSGVLCPKCLQKGMNKYMKERTNKKNDTKFYACPEPPYGDGCGYTENIE